MATGPTEPDRGTGSDGDGPTVSGPTGRGDPDSRTPGPTGRGDPGARTSGPTGGGDAAGNPSEPTGHTDASSTPPGPAGHGGASSTPPTPPVGRGRGRDAGDGSGQEMDAAAPTAPPTPFTQQLGRVTIVVLAALFGVFAVANSQRVDFSWVFGETIVRETATGDVTGGVPLILLLLAAFAIGSVVTLLVELFVSRGRRARRAAAGGRDDTGRSR